MSTVIFSVMEIIFITIQRLGADICIRESFPGYNIFSTLFITTLTIILISPMSSKLSNFYRC